MNFASGVLGSHIQKEMVVQTTTQCHRIADGLRRALTDQRGVFSRHQVAAAQETP